MVVGHEGVELQGVELEAGVMDVLHILHGVFVHGQQGGGLEGTQKNISMSYISYFYPFILSILVCISLHAHIACVCNK